MKRLPLAALLLLLALSACKKTETPREETAQASARSAASLRHTKQYPSTIATSWFNLEADLTRTTPGFGPGIAGRALAYSGVALYESVVPGMPSYQSAFKLLTGYSFPVEARKDYYWPASANAAMAQVIRKFFAATSPANLNLVNQTEANNLAAYQGEASAEDLARSVAFGKLVADSVFAWSQRDGGLPPFPIYNPVMPVAPGQWEPTPPGFGPGVTPNWGDFRSIVPNVAALTQPGPPVPYSTTPGSPYMNMVLNSWNIVSNLTRQDTLLVRTWAETPGNYNGHTHLTKVLTQLIMAEGFDLEQAATAYAQHGMAVADATISVFRTKYVYKTVRPITVFRNVLGHPLYNTVVPTPPHPEFPAAHAAISGASAEVLRAWFGNDHPFVDHTHDALYGPFAYTSISDYEQSSGWSRVLGGIHYTHAVDAGLAQGRAVGSRVLALPLKKP